MYFNLGFYHIASNVLLKDLVVTCFTEKGLRGARIIKEFTVKKWDSSSVNRVIKNESTVSTERKVGCGLSKSACTQNNVEQEEEVICPLEDNPGTHRSQIQMAIDLRVSRASVWRMIKKAGIEIL